MNKRKKTPKATTPQDVERVSIAIDARVAGKTWAEAARLAGYCNAPTAFRAVSNRLKQTLSLKADAYREFQTARLEAMLEALWLRALDPLDDQQIQAAEMVRKIIGDISKLHGLIVDMVEQTGDTVIDLTVERGVFKSALPGGDDSGLVIE